MILRIFASFAWILTRLGVDVDTFLAVLEVKLTQDQRRTISGVHAKSAKMPSRAFMMRLVTFTIFGAFMGLILVFVESPLVGLTVVNGFVMAMMGLMLVGDFTNVLMDTTDNTVLLPRPVSDRTLLAARTAHIVAYMGMLSLALSAGTIVTGAVVIHPLFPAVYLVVLVLSLMLVVFVVYLFYLFAMKRTNMDMFRDIVLYFQIGMTVFFFAAYQIIPRVMDMKEIKHLSIRDEWWIYLCPPAWLAAPVDLLAGNTGMPQLILTALALLVPPLCLYFIIRVLAPGFTSALAGLETSGSGGKSGGKKGRGAGQSVYARTCSMLFSGGPEERASFDLIWTLASRDRPFKLATYPSMAFVLIMTVVIFMGEADGGVKDDYQGLVQGRMYLFILYFAGFVAPIALLNLRYSSQHGASWLFLAMPLSRPGPVFSAGLKVVLARFSLPLFFIVAASVTAVWGARVVFDVLLAGSVLTSFSLLTAFMQTHAFPFSKARTAQASGQGAGFVLFMLFMAGAGAAHFGLTYVPFGVQAAFVCLVVLNVIGFRRYKRTTWNRLEM